MNKDELLAIAEEFKMQQEKEMQDCMEYGIACSFGICDECPIYGG